MKVPRSWCNVRGKVRARVVRAGGRHFSGFGGEENSRGFRKNPFVTSDWGLASGRLSVSQVMKDH